VSKFLDWNTAVCKSLFGLVSLTFDTLMEPLLYPMAEFILELITDASRLLVEKP